MFKMFKNKKTAEIIGQIKETESEFIENVNKEIKKMYIYNNEFYKVCERKEESRSAYVGCTGCNDCNKFNNLL